MGSDESQFKVSWGGAGGGGGGGGAKSKDSVHKTQLLKKKESQSKELNQHPPFTSLIPYY